MKGVVLQKSSTRPFALAAVPTLTLTLPTPTASITIFVHTLYAYGLGLKENGARDDGRREKRRGNLWCKVEGVATMYCNFENVRRLPRI